MQSSESEFELTPPNIVEAAYITCSNLIPEISKEKYTTAYNFCTFNMKRPLMSGNVEVSVNNANKPSPSASSESQITEFQVYGMRWVILSLFVICCAASTMHWIQYSIIADVIVKYYGVSYNAVDWSSMVYLLLYLVFIIPGVLVLDKVGLRVGVLIAMAGTCIGAWIKLLSVSPDRFWAVLLGQSVIAAAQVFLLCIPPKLAAVWFGPNEVSTACSIGVFGIQLGVAIGFLLPPMLVQDQENEEAIESDLYTMSLAVAILNTVLLLVLLLFFKAKPQSPPSRAQLLTQSNDKVVNFVGSLKELLTNPSYMLLVVAYGINVGLFYAISMLLNQIILEQYPDASADAGRIGLIIVVAGMISSVVCGVILDKFNRFKATILTVYALCIISMTAFTFTLTTGIIVVYLTSAILGFFMTGFFPIGYELAVELTYPISEETSAGILTGAGQAFGILFTYMYTFLIRNAGSTWTNLIMSALLVVGICFIGCIRYDLKRQAVQTEKVLGC